jgi:NAD-dependent deacetylase
MSAFRNIVVLTGAGLSAESGISTFRDKGGIWARYDYRDVATPEGFARNPALVLEFYNMRSRQNRGVQPNAAHKALARLEAEHDGEVLIVTQNVDLLQEAAGSRKLIHMHGDMGQTLCNGCGHRQPLAADAEIALDAVCTACAGVGMMRPDVVWFGEMPYHMDRIYAALGEADLFISVGTSGTVYPAAGFVAEARAAGAHTVELNLEPSEGVSHFHQTIHGRATQVVPAYVERLLAGATR